MWEWLEKNPGKNKNHYSLYLFQNGRGNEYDECWACIEAEVRQQTKMIPKASCNYCPITWHNERVTTECVDTDSPYEKWLSSETDKDRKKIRRRNGKTDKRNLEGVEDAN